MTGPLVPGPWPDCEVCRERHVRESHRLGTDAPVTWAESVTAYLANHPDVAERTQRRIYTGIPGVCRDPWHVHEEFTCPACGEEAAALDVERLARALESDAVRDIAIHYEPERAAAAIAREYARLQEEKP